MNNIEKIQYLRKLEMQKDELEKELMAISRSIDEQKDSCLHIGVNLGYYALCPSTYNKYRCLICGKKISKEYFFESEYTVNSENYLLKYDTEDEEQCDKKFDLIQTLALGLLKEEPNISREELVVKLNKLIQESISFRESQSASKSDKTRIKQY